MPAMWVLRLKLCPRPPPRPRWLARPLQRTLATRIGVSWEDFALVSPDIFRKFLLDYATLGEAYKYAGSLTGHELQVIDQKLDRYMARKAARGFRCGEAGRIRPLWDLFIGAKTEGYADVSPWV